MIKIDYFVSGKKHVLQCAHDANNEHMIVESSNTDSNIHLKVKAKTKLILGNVYQNVTLPITPDTVQLNGYQSWTDSDQVKPYECYKPCNRLFDYIFKTYGDYGFTKTSWHVGQFNSYTYVIYKKDNHVVCFNSNDEKSATTIYEVDYSKPYVTIRRDYEGKVLDTDQAVTLMDISMKQGEEESIYAQVFEKENYTPISGWTSWYNYYTNINYEILDENLQDIIDTTMPYDVFQIDDGYQTAVGDWLSLKPSFLSGLSALATKAKNNGMKAGLWLAPFVAERNSNLYKTHRDWFVRIKGKPLKAGWNPGWSGNFYTLDIYNVEVRAYLKEIFDTVKKQWGFNFVKLDFLYAIASKPYYGKSRGEIMYDGIQLLRELCDGIEILGCGVPLGQAKGVFDYCRIGSDVAPYYEDKKLKMLNYRERVSTYNSLKSTIGRSMLNGHCFINDPDVFLMRSENNTMTKEQKQLLFVLNNLLGGLVFTSDKIGNYSEKELQMVKTMFPQKKVEVKNIRKLDDCYEIVVTSRNRHYNIYANLGDTVTVFDIKDILVDNRQFLETSSEIHVGPYEVRVMAHVTKTVGIWWTDNHVLPCGNLVTLELDDIEAMVVDEKAISPSMAVYTSRQTSVEDRLLGKIEELNVYLRIL